MVDVVNTTRCPASKPNLREGKQIFLKQRAIYALAPSWKLQDFPPLMFYNHLVILSRMPFYWPTPLYLQTPSNFNFTTIPGCVKQTRVQ